jgi:hypothetical protein
MWPALNAEVVSRFHRQSANGVAHVEKLLNSRGDAINVEGWDSCIEKLLELRRYEDDWDGQGAEAPSPEAVDSAIILAVLLRQSGVEPPCRTVPIVNGAVVLEWQWPDVTTLEIEIAEPYLAEVFLMVPGIPCEHWRIDGSKGPLMEAGVHGANS